MLKQERKGILLGCWQEKQLNKGKNKAKQKLGNAPSPTIPTLVTCIHSEPHCLCREMLEHVEGLSRGSHSLDVPQSARQAQRDPLFFGGIPNASAGGILYPLQLVEGMRLHFFPSQTVGPLVWSHLPTQGGWDVSVLHVGRLESHGSVVSREQQRERLSVRAFLTWDVSV